MNKVILLNYESTEMGDSLAMEQHVRFLVGKYGIVAVNELMNLIFDVVTYDEISSEQDEPQTTEPKAGQA